MNSITPYPEWPLIQVVHYLDLKEGGFYYWWTVRVDLFPIPVQAPPLTTDDIRPYRLGLTGLGTVPMEHRWTAWARKPYGMVNAYTRGRHLPGVAESLLLGYRGDDP